MTDAQQPEAQPVDWQALWGLDLIQTYCPVCDCAFLIPKAVDSKACPNCFRADLIEIDNSVVEPDLAREPEGLLPFKINQTQAINRAMRFIEPIKSPSDDLTRDNLKARLRRVYLPLWLVDADVNASWSMDIGADEHVGTKEEVYSGETWLVKEVQRPRPRWKPSVGKLARHYDNIHASALDAYFYLESRIGDYDEQSADAYWPGAVGEAFILLPERSTDQAWSDAVLALKKHAEAEAKQALSADRSRDYHWNPNFGNLNWTFLLVPLYSTYYLNDDRLPQVLFIHGQTGGVGGPLVGSTLRARRLSMVGVASSIALVGLGLFLGYLGLAQDQFLYVILAGLSFVAAVAALFLLFRPLTEVTEFNQRYGRMPANARASMAAMRTRGPIWVKPYDTDVGPS